MSPLPDRLAPQPWMSAEPTRAVIAALEAAGGLGAARFVGGCVRNALIGAPIDDVDIATVLTPDQVMAALKAAGLKFAPTGVEHGTVTAIAQGQPFEVTTLRRDVETDGRRAVVAFTTDWAEDAQRRDFRLNALYMDGEGRLHDPVGHGVEDALAARIVFVGDADMRIREDYLRILRFFRFNAWYGRGRPDAEGLAACARLKDGVTQLSAERVSKELLKLFAASDPRPALEAMEATGVLAAVLPRARSGAKPLKHFANLVGLEREVLDESEPVLRLLALLEVDPQGAMAEADRLRLSKAQRERLSAAAGTEPTLTYNMGEAAARRLIYRLGAQAFRDRVKLAWAATRDPFTGARPWRALIREADDWAAPKFPMTGADAAKAGIAAGPAMGRALREAEDWWVDNDFTPDREALLARLKG